MVNVLEPQFAILKSNIKLSHKYLQQLKKSNVSHANLVAFTVNCKIPLNLSDLYSVDNVMPDMNLIQPVHAVQVIL